MTPIMTMLAAVTSANNPGSLRYVRIPAREAERSIFLALHESFPFGKLTVDRAKSVC